MANVEAAAATEHFMPVSSDPSSAAALKSNAHCGAQAGVAKRKIDALSASPGLPVMIDELAVGVQRKLSDQNIVVKENSDLGLVRQAQRGFHNNAAQSLLSR